MALAAAPGGAYDLAGDAMKLDGKVAVVTGTSPNIGAGIAAALAEEGATVVCVDLVASNAERCAAWLASRGATTSALTCDITDEAQVEAMVRAVRDAHGSIDVLVNNAGVLRGHGVLEMPLERWQRQIGVNLTGTFLCTKHVARLMVEQGRGGSIIVIASTAAHQGQAGNIGYTTSKGGLLNFARAAAMDLARYGIRVNTLTPTATDPAERRERTATWQIEPAAETPRGDSGGSLDFQRLVPLGRLPGPRHYGKAAVFLASDDSEMVTGIDLRVDGGAIAKYWPWTPPER
jgi:NAD(P)-dependent dehydrogenase (short-subunit alcohol dehydrogenase family)